MIDTSTPAAVADLAPDVLVIGGGPAGTTAATLLARRGWKVTLLEKTRHPRFHIGESLLPMSMGVLERLGVLEQVREIGVLKLGADFPLDDGTYSMFRFERALGMRHGYAFQVKREDFDRILFDHARANGVQVLEETCAERVEMGEDGRPARVQVRSADGGTQTYTPRYVVDASGRDALLGGQLKCKRKNPKHQSAAVFSHFTGVERREGDAAGNITVLRHAHGWIWIIPLRDGVSSVGAVCAPEALKTRKGDTEGFLMRTLASVPAAAERMVDATRVAPVHVTGNYAYECTRMSGSGWVMLGDAWSFVDPMFSSGVFLAMHSAECGAEAIDAALRDPSREAKIMSALERRLTRGLDEFKWFIYRFTTPTMKRLFANPHNVFQVEQAVIGMLAGDVFDNKPVLRRLRIFRLIYAANALRMAPQALRDWRHRRRQARIDFREETLQREGAR